MKPERKLTFVNLLLLRLPSASNACTSSPACSRILAFPMQHGIGFGDESEDLQLLRLPNAMGTIQSLQIGSQIPITTKRRYRRRSSN